MTAKATTTKGHGYNSTRGRDVGLPNIETEIPDVGKALISHAQACSVGFMPREDSEAQILITITKLTRGDDEYAGLGLMAALTPDEARQIGSSLLLMADGGLDAVKPRH